jgi:hypothetical protein
LHRYDRAECRADDGFSFLFPPNDAANCTSDADGVERGCGHWGRE